MVQKALDKFKKKINKQGLEIHYDGDFPSRSGVGSSSSFAVGLLNVLNNFFNKKINKRALANQSLHLERTILKETVGSQDQVAAAFGGFNEIKFLKSDKYQVTPLITNKKELKTLQEKFVLVFTGVRKKNGTANTVAKAYIDKLDNTKKKYILEIIGHAKKAKKLIYNKDYDAFGRLLNTTWEMKKNLSDNMSNTKIDKMYDLGLRHGALGAKLLGAGSAGYLLFYVPTKKKKNFLKKFKKFITISLKFENKGSEIIFNDKGN